MKMPSGYVPFLILLRVLQTKVYAAAIPPQDPLIHEAPCPNYATYSQTRHENDLSPGRYHLPFQRPSKECRTYHSEEVEDAIVRMKAKIHDPDLYRLFENAFPNTLDTAVKWKGFAWANETTDEGIGEETDEDLAFVITGDMYVEAPTNILSSCSQNFRDAMWLRDSANQVLSYLPVLQPSSDSNSLAALFRGVINAHSRYIKYTPYCHAYPPPPESGLTIPRNGAYHRNKVTMFGKQGYDTRKTFDCKWELDSLASFLQISSEYYNATGDIGPFEKYKWVDTVEVILDAAEAMRSATYTEDGHIAESGYTMTGQTDRATETTSNNGLGNPVIWTGMVRSTFRPSDDATIFQYFIPGNMMFARYLEAAAPIMETLNMARSIDIALRMRAMAAEIRAGITKYGIVSHPSFGAMFAFEVDGYGSQVCYLKSSDEQVCGC